MFNILITSIFLYLSRLTTKPTKWHVRPVKTRINLASAQSDQSLLCPHELSLERTAKPLIRLGDLSLRWAPRSFCWFCHEVTHFTLSHWRQQYWFLLIRGVLFPETLRESEGFYVSMHMYVSVYYVILQTNSNTHLYLSRWSTRLTVHIAFWSAQEET